MNPIQVNYHLLTDTATAPTKAHPEDACFDLYADIRDGDDPYGEGKVTVIPPHETVLIHTGFSTEIPEGYWAPIFARSGIATKRGLRPAQGVAVIDSNYRGEWLVPLHNDTNTRRYVTHGERIAQFMILPVLPVYLTPVDYLSETDRGNGGFGSTGSK